MSDKPKADTSGHVLSEMAEHDVEQPGDTPSDVPPAVADADTETEAKPD